MQASPCVQRQAHLLMDGKFPKQRGDVKRVQAHHVVRKRDTHILRRVVARRARARTAHRDGHRLPQQHC